MPNFQSITPEQVIRMPGKPSVDYELDRPPYTRYHWNGSQMVEMGAVSGAWKPIGFDVAGQVPIAVFGQLSDGRYVCTDGVLGAYATQLWLLTGDPLVPGYASAALANTSMSAGNALKNTLGAVVAGANAGIFNAWPTSNGDIYFVARGDADTRNYLYRAKAGTFTVGSDAAYNNKQACIDIGRYGGSHTDGIRHLSNRSFLEAKVGNATHLFFVEYNVAGGRVAGGANDQAIVRRSTDGGTTWAIFLEFNTGGAHVVDHFHGAVQDPYSKWIYFMSGDVGTQNNIIAYNGTAAAPAANTALATLATTAGWKVINGSAATRFTDLSFTALGVYGLPDSDSNSDASVNAYQGVQFPKTLEYPSLMGGTTVRQTNLPPLLNLQQPGWAACLSFRTHVDAVTPEPYLQIWTADFEGGTWTLTNKVRNYRAATAVPKGFFIDQAGRVWISGTYGGGIQFASSGSAAQINASSIALTPVVRGASLPSIYNGI